jgi:CubicO group peptidase (beta-lactamase class C family)
MNRESDIDPCTLAFHPNGDLSVVDGNKSRWTTADYRRWGFHNLHRIARYGISLRSASVMKLEKRIDLRIAENLVVQQLTTLPWFSGMIVVRGQHILFERYAPDFTQDQPHSIQSITKTLMNLIVGKLVSAGVLDLSRTIAHYVPEIGSGYADATLQQVLNMDVHNDYSEDFTDPEATYYRHEEAMGWRLPRSGGREETQRAFLRQIQSADTRNRSGFAQYKDANTDVLGWVVESASGRPLRSYLAEIVDAGGLEGTFYITTDREGFPTLDGGACLSARDLARYLSIFVRGGSGVNGESVGSDQFIKDTLSGGVPMPTPYDGLRYKNHMMVSDASLCHGGWAGQFAVINLRTGIIAVYLGVIEDQHGTDRFYRPPMIQMLHSVASGAGTPP